jgi:precorrin-6y C5,15-methyltransferase (decarboxylating) CbiE subunit
MKKIAVVSISLPGASIGDKITQGLKQLGFDVQHYHKYESNVGIMYKSPIQQLFEEIYSTVDGIVAIMALGGLVRVIAHLLRSKLNDPAIVCVDDAARFCISVCSGHLGGANELTRIVAKILGSIPVITTATDSLGKMSVEEMAEKFMCEIKNFDNLLQVNAAIVNNKKVGVLFLVKFPMIEQGEHVNEEELLEKEKQYDALVVISDKEPKGLTKPYVWLKPKRKVVIGIGSVKGVTKDEVIKAIIQALKKASLSLDDVQAVASIKEEKGFVEACKELGLRFVKVEKDLIKMFTHPELSPPSSQALKHIGLPGVAEPCALYVAGKGSTLILKKTRFWNRITIAIAAVPSSTQKGKLYVVGVGPGSPDYLTDIAKRAILDAKVIAGFAHPLRTVSHLLAGKSVLTLTLKDSKQKIEEISKKVEQGETCAIVLTGDPCFSEKELLQKIPCEFEIIPGISSVQVAAAKCNVSLDKAYVLTLHESGERWLLEQKLREVVQSIKDGKPVILLPRPYDLMPNEIASILISLGAPKNTPVRVYENLTLDNERETKATLESLPHKEYSSLTIMVIGA